MRFARTWALALLSLAVSSVAWAQPGEGTDPEPRTEPPAIAEESREPKPVTTAAPTRPSTGLGPLLPSSSTAMGRGDTESPAEKKKEQEDEEQILADDWWARARTPVELHGNFRLRAELFRNFTLGRIDPASTGLWSSPADHSSSTWPIDSGQQPTTVPFCGDDPLNPATKSCKNTTHAGANIRFRLNPEFHLSDNLRISSQIDMLDNLVLGSTPDGYANQPSPNGGYDRVARSGYTPLGAFYNTSSPPTSGQNSYKDSIAVKRVWGEYVSPVGRLRFGRMPSHWGLGILENSGDTFDSDYQSTVDRIQFIGGSSSLDLFFGGAWEFPAEGAISEGLSDQQGQPYDLAQLDDVNQYTLMLYRRRNAALQALDLSRGDVVVNGGVYFIYRHQFLANDEAGVSTPTTQHLGADADDIRAGYVRRDLKMYIPDLWLQVLYRKFRFEMEALTVQGSLDNTEFTGGANNYQNRTDPDDNGWKIRQWGIATQTEYKAIEDRLRLHFGFGWASGDPDVLGLTPSNTTAFGQTTSDRTASTFRFHPDYRVDLIFFRHILNRIQGTYYFRPSVDYDVVRTEQGTRAGGSLTAIWSRASEFVQAPGHKRDLGVEIDVSLYLQARDGAPAEREDAEGSFFTMLQYGVFFPLEGLGYLPGEKANAAAANIQLDTSPAHALRWFAGVFF